MNLGKTLKNMRERRGLSQGQVARDSGLTPSFVSLIEAGKRDITFKTLEKLAKGLDVPVEVLLWDAAEIPENLPAKDQAICEQAKTLVERFVGSLTEGDSAEVGN